MTSTSEPGDCDLTQSSNAERGMMRPHNYRVNTRDHNTYYRLVECTWLVVTCFENRSSPMADDGRCRLRDWKQHFNSQHWPDRV